ncbi:short chain dehydrogenase [Shimazuella sp. AN120528]|uniref:short chain dehydrogenase n=1 Tax=Shimazuella soli TaxID=1892854 RepID=UPI001F0EA0C1|nr:short chain dehydrogenase [Shimazuella soli]MCH5586114.1 short chain dehydrogenase [Shimazuella soli]
MTEENTKKILVIGATGTIGSAVSEALENQNYEVICASRNGDYRVDLEKPATIEELFARIGKVHAVVVTAGSGTLTPFLEITTDNFIDGMKSKVFGQFALLQHAIDFVFNGESITITSGNMFEHLIPGSGVGAFVNNGLDGLVRAVASELPRGLRINAVSPGWVRESLEKMDYNLRTQLGVENMNGIPANHVAQAYIQSIEGNMQGETIFPTV